MAWQLPIDKMAQQERANKLTGRFIEELDWMVEEMNRWMKRRIERSRARCERSSLRQQLVNENVKRNAVGAPTRKDQKEVSTTSR